MGQIKNNKLIELANTIRTLHVCSFSTHSIYGKQTGFSCFNYLFFGCIFRRTIYFYTIPGECRKQCSQSICCSCSEERHSFTENIIHMIIVLKKIWFYCVPNHWYGSRRYFLGSSMSFRILHVHDILGLLT